jgi:hypothetical protein
MATSKRTARSSSPKTVSLVDRDGNTYQSSSPAEINNLVYGQGYRPSDSKTPLAEQVAALIAADPTPAQPAPSSPQPSTSA